MEAGILWNGKSTIVPYQPQNWSPSMTEYPLLKCPFSAPKGVIPHCGSLWPFLEWEPVSEGYPAGTGAPLCSLCIPWDKGLPWLSVIASIYIRAALKLILREMGRTALSCQRNSCFNCWTPSPNLPYTSTMKSIGAFTGDKASLSPWCSAVAQLMEGQAATGTATNLVLCLFRTRIGTLAWLSSSYVIKFA